MAFYGIVYVTYCVAVIQTRNMLQQNDKAPDDIQVVDQHNKSVSLQDYAGSFVVLYFYPKDNTPGCTTEACEFRDFNEDIKKLGVQVIGVSKDTPASHEKFAAKHNLQFVLWSDQNSALMNAFGVKGLVGSKRVTFVINPEGEIIHVWEKVNALGHAKEVFDFLQQHITH